MFLIPLGHVFEVFLAFLLICGYEGEKGKKMEKKKSKTNQVREKNIKPIFFHLLKLELHVTLSRVHLDH